MTEDHFYVGYINKTLEGELMKYQKDIMDYLRIHEKVIFDVNYVEI